MSRDHTADTWLEEETAAKVRRGMEDVETGRVRPMEEVFGELEKN